MPPKQQKLSFAGSSSSSDKRPREEVSPTPQYGRTESPAPAPAPESFQFTPGGGFRALAAAPSYAHADAFFQLCEDVEKLRSTFTRDLQELSNTVLEKNAIIEKLQEQVNELVSRPPPLSQTVGMGQPLVQPHLQQIPPQPRAPRLNKNNPGKATTTPTPTPAPNKPPQATSAKVDADTGFTTVTRKKQKKKPTTLLPPPQPTADRKLIFKLTSAPTVPATTAATQALRVINKAIVDHPDIIHPPCLSAHITQSNSLVVIVAESYRATDYDRYLGILQEALQADKFPIAGSFVSERWSRFVLNGVPADASPEDVQREIGTLYPSIRLGTSPRWLTTPERRHGKTASSMVITVTGQHTIKSIGRSRLYLFNNRCNLKEYITFGPSTRCGRCQLYGHPTPRCTAQLPACGVCAQAHLTKHHPCAIPSCKKGPACSHPPVMCVSCRQPHKAADPTCPTFLKLLTQGSSKGKEVEVLMTEL
jgi:uncharacterized coiled-coil protein SlyX